ncbi:hypothetical protein NQ317_016228 [Molorchus minor]|uniref:ribonuclease H n=1 Tax=Molorchus minor TaxID=1323400 RepID=A0ABQ9JEZ9_9CUCU|nr:hypothetical protein NQ317_016228 [Molorchus minor]
MLQRLAALGTTGVKNNTAQAALEAILNLQPLEWFIKGRAAKCALRLRESILWKSTKKGHSRILAVIGKMRGRVNIRIPSKEDWTNNGVIEEGETSVYTDASITLAGAGAGIYSEALDIRKAYKLTEGCSALQAEICAIREAARLIGEIDSPPGDVIIYSDSQAAIKSIASKMTRSKVALSCREALSWIRGCRVELRWVPGHRNVKGNVEADRLAKQAAESNGAVVIDSPLPPINVLKEAIEEVVQRKQEEIWQNRDDCAIARKLWPSIDENRTKQLLKYKKNPVRIAVGVITGNCAVGVNLKKWRITADDFCRECDEEEETIEHLLCQCPLLESRRLEMLGQCFLDGLDEAAEMDIGKIASFARSWKCFKAEL